MDTLYIIFSALIQSLTEFLPVSSSGHLVIWHHFLNSPVNALHLDIVLHLGSALALLVFFWSDIVRILKAWFKSLTGHCSGDSRLGWMLIVSTLPAAIVGFLAEDFITNIFRSTTWVIVMLILVAVIFILVERYARAEKDLTSINFKKAVLIGLAQCLALIPGTSRSGITIVAGMLAKIKRAEAARYSFLLAIPTILGASCRGLTMIASQGTTMSSMIKLGIGLFICFVFSFYVIKYFIRYLNTHSLRVFAWYRIILAVVVWLVLAI